MFDMSKRKENRVCDHNSFFYLFKDKKWINTLFRRIECLFLSYKVLDVEK